MASRFYTDTEVNKPASGYSVGDYCYVQATSKLYQANGALAWVTPTSWAELPPGSCTSMGVMTSGGLGAGATIGGVSMSLGNDANYDLYYRNNSGILTRLAAGTDGQVLTTHGTASAPTWTTVNGTGTVTSVAIATANGISGVVSNASTTPSITLTLGAITPSTITPTNTINHVAGTTTIAPESFTISGAALLSSATAGSGEVDAGGIRYYTHATNERGVMDTMQFVSLTSTNTLTSQTGAQPIFDGGGGPAGGALTVASSKSYFFECFFTLSSLSSTSGSFGYAFGGTATFTSQGWHTAALKATTLTTAATMQTTYNTGANTAIVSANTATGGIIRVWGIVRINAGGTLIPQVSLGIAAAGVVGVNSYFKIWPIGTNTVVSVGNWS